MDTLCYSYVRCWMESFCPLKMTFAPAILCLLEAESSSISEQILRKLKFLCLPLMLNSCSYQVPMMAHQCTPCVLPLFCSFDQDLEFISQLTSIKPHFHKVFMYLVNLIEGFCCCGFRRGLAGGVPIAGKQTATNCTLALQFLQWSGATPATNVSLAPSSTDFLASVLMLLISSYSLS